jgi:hypothetical protein
MWDVLEAVGKFWVLVAGGVKYVDKNHMLLVVQKGSKVNNHHFELIPVNPL